jgi:hypothetical protein
VIDREPHRACALFSVTKSCLIFQHKVVVKRQGWGLPRGSKAQEITRRPNIPDNGEPRPPVTSAPGVNQQTSERGRAPGDVAVEGVEGVAVLGATCWVRGVGVSEGRWSEQQRSEGRWSKVSGVKKGSDGWGSGG